MSLCARPANFTVMLNLSPVDALVGYARLCAGPDVIARQPGHNRRCPSHRSESHRMVLRLPSPRRLEDRSNVAVNSVCNENESEHVRAPCVLGDQRIGCRREMVASRYSGLRSPQVDSTSGRLPRKGRIVISATEADREVNETLFPHFLAELLKSPIDPDEFDADNDKSILLFDLFVNVTKPVAQNYAGENALFTEHAWLGDNGDGRGTGVQLDCLPPAWGGRKTDSFTPKHMPNHDGTRAANSPLGTDRKRSRPTEETVR